MINFVNSLNSHALLNILLLSHDATAIYTGEELHIQLVNDAMLRIWGKEKGIHGMRFEDALPEMAGQPFTELLKNVWRTAESYEAKDTPCELIVDGKRQTFYFDFVYSAIKDENGDMYCILHTATEVTERMFAWQELKQSREKEQQINEELAASVEEYESTNEELLVSRQEMHEVIDHLNQSEGRFRTLVEQSPVAMASLKGRELTIDVANQKVLQIWGKDQSILGLTLAQALPEIQSQSFLKILDQVFTSGEAFYGQELKATLEHDGKLKDCYLNFVYQPIKDRKGDTTSILIVANDVTEQVDARKSVEEVNIRLEIALDASKLGSTEVDLATGIMQSTEQFKKNYGYTKDEDFQYSDLFNAMLPEYRDEVKSLVQAAIASNGIYEAEYPVRWRDGSIHWIQAHGRPRYDDHGKANRMVGMTADITEQKLFEQRKDDFLSIASHELKTPVTSLKASLQMLDKLKNRPMSDMHLKLIEQANRSMDKMSVLVDDLLNTNRMTEGQLKLQKTRFNVAEMLSLCCNHVRLEGKYELVQEGNPGLELYADEHRIDQVVVNFVNNAVKYAPESMNIYLKVEDLGEFVKVSVRDTGPGIAQEKLPNLFDRYYRGDHSSIGYTGLGLGLYICAEIIKRHGGEIGVDSELGVGTTFWFTLPAAV